MKTMNAALLLVCALGLAACAVVADPVERADRFVRLGKSSQPVRLAYRDEGKGPPILLIHGFGANIYTWRHLEPALAARHRVLSIDLKGFGRSDKPFDQNYSLFDQADLVASFIEQQDLHDLTVIGHSFGGGVALALALDKRPALRGRIKRLVLIDTIAYPQKIPIFLKVLRTPVVAQVGTTVTPPFVQAQTALKLAYYDDSKISFQDINAYAQPLTTAGGKHALIQTARHMDPESFRPMIRRYGTIQQPALILWCTEDKVVPDKVGRQLHSALPNSTLRIFRDCGHLPQEEKPQQTADAILAFLNR
jgi:pimeloyl-ACP methyl ester carboxylesterase